MICLLVLFVGFLFSFLIFYSFIDFFYLFWFGLGVLWFCFLRERQKENMNFGGHKGGKDLGGVTREERIL